MDTTASEVLQFVKESDVKFIRLGFCDLFGFQKNIAIMPGELLAALSTVFRSTHRLSKVLGISATRICCFS